ncbi:MAG TPA: VWA domain-containing protein [Vicinamibacterales bacterium]|nr:VWA domain-containing protein [Vicinamibacterales bacterium]
MDGVLSATVVRTGVGVLAAGLVASMASLAAQQPTFRTSTQVVSLFATVTDGQNRLVPDLTRDDFSVLDNDKPQELVVFENQNQPITVVVMLDTSGSMTASIQLLKAAAEQFITRLLPEDKAAVGAFNDKIELSASFSNDRDALITEVKDLDFGNGTRLYDALNESLNQLRGIDGRRVVLVFTDGDDTSSRVGRGAILERARAEEVMIYSIGLQSEYFDGARTVRSRPDSGLRRLSDETGGGYFELKQTSDLGPTFTRVAQELHSQYVLGFEAQQLDGKVHKLTVRMKQAGMTARARRSYVAAAAQASPGR